MGDDQVAAAQTQDALRPLRQFVAAFQAGLGSDQSYAYTDSGVMNMPGQFVAVGSNGAAAIEGQPVVVSAAGVGLQLPPWLIWLGLGALAYHFAKKV